MHPNREGRLVHHAPEVTVVVRRVRKDSRRGHYELHLGSVLRVRHWNRRTEMPSA
jgi:hypothetical protein